MAQQLQHFIQAEKNLDFLKHINSSSPATIDWQVTVCFYTAVHLINAHLATFDMHYQTHEKVKNAINPFIETSLTRLPEAEYTAFVKLQSLSRRSRYLVNDSTNDNKQASFTYGKHQGRALRHLNTIIQYYCKKYKTSMPPVEIACAEIGLGEKLDSFTIVKV